MASDNHFSEVMGSLLQGMDNYLSAKTVVGEPMTVGDTVIVPLVDISFGAGAAAGLNDSNKSNTGGGGMGGKLSANSVLVTQNGITRLVSVKSQDTVNKVLDMVPGVIDRVSAFAAGKGDPLGDPEVRAAVDEAFETEEAES